MRLHLRRVLGGPDVPRETWRLGIAFAYLQRLRVAINARAASAQTQLDTLRSILSPAQLVRYLAWVERNRNRIRAGTEASIVHPAAAAPVLPAGASTLGDAVVYGHADSLAAAAAATGSRRAGSGAAAAAALEAGDSAASTPDTAAWAAASITPTTMAFAHAAPHMLQPFASAGGPVPGRSAATAGGMIASLPRPAQTCAPNVGIHTQPGLDLVDTPPIGGSGAVIPGLLPASRGGGGQ
jgi:hypothetical protein